MFDLSYVPGTHFYRHKTKYTVPVCKCMENENSCKLTLMHRYHVGARVTVTAGSMIGFPKHFYVIFHIFNDDLNFYVNVT